MTWTKINTNGSFFKFESPGDQLEGSWSGITQGQFGPVGTIRTDDGEKLFTVNKALEDLDRIEKGKKIKILYTGWGESKRSGHDYKHVRHLRRRGRTFRGHAGGCPNIAARPWMFGTYSLDLKGVKKTGPNKWMAQCPVHRDTVPSLSIGVGRNGRILLHCFAGCKYEDIVAALGISKQRHAKFKTYNSRKRKTENL